LVFCDVLLMISVHRDMAKRMTWIFQILWFCFILL
jgi:hypothetical protein